MTFGELAQLIVVLAALHRASGAVIFVGVVALIVLQRVARRIPTPWDGP